MIALAMAFLTATPSLFVLAAAVLAGIAGGWLGLFGPGWSVVASVAGRLLLAAFLFLGGYRTASDEAASKAQLALLQGEINAANAELTHWKETAELRSEQLKELAKRRSERDAQVARSEARIAKLPDAVRRGRGATRDDDRELCRIAGGKAPGC